jgi:DNA (cytosine-5)-methyltransferase 1
MTRLDLGIEPTFPTPNKQIITVQQALKGLKDLGETFYLKEDSKKMWGQLQWGGFNKVHPKGHWYNQVKINPNKPSPTITKIVWYMGGSGLIHYAEPRFLTINELKRLASFPDDFMFLGKYQEQWARIGNAVMPNMMRAIAENLKKEVFDKLPIVETSGGGGQ